MEPSSHPLSRAIARRRREREALPERPELLFRDRPPKLEPWAFSASELRALSARGDPRARELATEGVVLGGEGLLADLLG